METTFELNGITYYVKNGRFYKVVDGKTTRIGEEEYDHAGHEKTREEEKAAAETEANKRMQEMAEAKKNAENAGYKFDILWDGDVFTHHVYRDGKKVASGYTFEEVLEAATKDMEKKPKPKATRKSKSAVFEMDLSDGRHVTLTDKQVDFIRRLPNSCYWENDLDSTLWIDCLADDIGGQFANKPMTIGAMISTLCEKGLGTRAKGKMNNHKSTSFSLTEDGKEVAIALGLN